MVVLSSFDPFLKLLIPVCPETLNDLVHSLVVGYPAIKCQYPSFQMRWDVFLLRRFGVRVPMHLRLAFSIEDVLRLGKLQLFDESKGSLIV